MFHPLDSRAIFLQGTTPVTLFTPELDQDTQEALSEAKRRIERAVCMYEQHMRFMSDSARAAYKRDVSKSARDLIAQLDRLSRTGLSGKQLLEMTDRSLKTFIDTSFLVLQDTHTFLRERDVQYQEHDVLCEHLDGLSLAPPPYIPSTPSVLQGDSSSLPGSSSSLFRKHVTHVAVAASAVHAVDQVVNLVVGGAITGIAKGTQAVCDSHPILQQGCHKVAVGGSQLVETIHDMTEEYLEEYWEGSSAEQGLQALSSTCSAQYQKGSQAFDEILRQQNLSPSEMNEYKQNLTTVGVGVLSVGLAGGTVVGTAGVVHKIARAGKIAKTAQANIATASKATQVTKTTLRSSFLEFLSDEGGKLPINRDFYMRLFKGIGYEVVPGGKGSHTKLRRSNSPMVILPCKKELTPIVAKELLKIFKKANSGQ